MARRIAVLPCLTALWLVAAGPDAANGQVVRGRLVDAAGGSGIGGAMVSLEDRAGRSFDRVLTRTGSGLFELRILEPGEYRIRAERIGYATTLSDFFSVASTDTVTIELAARIEPISLAGVEAEADRRCRVRPEEGLAVARVWEEARKALAAAAWTRERGLYRYEMLTIRRRLDARGRRVEREDRDYLEVSAATPYESRPADSLLAEGFVRLSDQGVVFWGPDADVLLSDYFVDTHCFRLAPGERREGEPLGLEFEPVPDRDVAEVAGTMWLDPVSAHLRRLDFQYVNLGVPSRLMRASPGGSVEFTTLPNGTWIVPSWHLRMFRPDPAASLAAIIMEHGEVLRVRDQRGVVFEGDRGGRIVGTVFDSLRAGLPGARVFLDGDGTDVVTDADGRFEMTHLGPWTYAVHFNHPYMERLGYRPEPVDVEMGSDASGPVRVDFEAPRMNEVLDNVCAGVGQPGPTQTAEGRIVWYEGVLTMAVTDSDGNPVADAGVLTVTAAPGAEDLEEDGHRVIGRTSASGLYRMCWVPVDLPLELVALNRGERFDRGAFEDGAALADLFPGRVQRITIAREVPHRTLVLRVETR